MKKIILFINLLIFSSAHGNFQEKANLNDFNSFLGKLGLSHLSRIELLEKLEKCFENTPHEALIRNSLNEIIQNISREGLGIDKHGIVAVQLHNPPCEVFIADQNFKAFMLRAKYFGFGALTSSIIIYIYYLWTQNKNDQQN